MKKIVIFIVSALLLGSVLVGCQTNSGSKRKTNKDLMLLEDSFEQEFYGIATKKDNIALRDRIQIALNKSIEDGTAEKISKKWFGENLMFKPDIPTFEPDPNGQYEKETIILGCDVNFAPMGFKEGENIVGFDIDLAKEVIENKMGKKLIVQPISWDSKEAELNANKIDVIWNGLSITPKRLENMCFTEAYMKNTQVVIVAKDSDIKNAKDLNGKRVAMQKQSTAVDAFEKTGIQAKDKLELADNVACLNELKTGRVDGVVMDETVANYYLNYQADEQ